MSIHLFGDYYFDRDKLNWILQVQKFSKKKGENVMKNIAYFGNPTQMAQHVAQHAALNAASDADSLDELIEAIDALTAVALESVRRKAA